MPSYGSCDATKVQNCVADLPQPDPSKPLCKIVQDGISDTANCQLIVGGEACLQVAKTQCYLNQQLELAQDKCNITCDALGAGLSAGIIFVIVAALVIGLLLVVFLIRWARNRRTNQAMMTTTIISTGQGGYAPPAEQHVVSTTTTYGSA